MTVYIMKNGSIFLIAAFVGLYGAAIGEEVSPVSQIA